MSFIGMNSLEEVDFKIITVRSGWFEATIAKDCKTTELIASNYLSNDGPCDLLDALLELFRDKLGETDNEKWVVWDGEPCATIWRLKKDENNIHVSVYISDIESYEIVRSLTYESIVNESEFEAVTDFNSFICKIVLSFEELLERISVSQYEEEWNTFPAQQLEELKIIIAGSHALKC